MATELTQEERVQARMRNRVSISAEVFGKHNKPKKFVPPVFNKTSEQNDHIRNSLEHCFLFRGVGHNDIEILIKAFDIKEFKAGDVIIKQGDQGDKLYLVHRGVAECWKNKAAEGKDVFLCNRGPGECFGELALLYNAPRAATVIAKTDIHLWSLDRETFNRVVKAGVVERRQRYDKILKNVVLFNKLDPYDRCRLADALQEIVIENENIITEGDHGDCMYMLIQGRAEAICQGKIVKSYSDGDYFGEIALIEHKPRATSVRAIVGLHAITIYYQGKCRLATLARESCIDLLGPMEQMLQNNMQEYRRILAQFHIDKQI
ncbi:bifunctional Cyclic nucleotide-binding domain/Cyclic nucleotide-binding [Babesia duncani]|uniref:Bifunctional Cyclic nucleotide-binding domain/Cyclic nucleotide-binding n=1 Tax=Babesia duncani TaxID=323732 RepID=A0AAD9PIN8_9APIC|nr:bifunctional Cyclic nucleotide-binding domain/Cyclic nucleotide-binding [Babesia duncani]